jgi:hypothetical protein
LGDWNLEVGNLSMPKLSRRPLRCAPLGELGVLGVFAVKKVIDFVVNSNLVIVTTL